MDDKSFKIGGGKVWPFHWGWGRQEELLVHRTYLGCPCSASKRIKMQVATSKNTRGLRSPLMPCFLAAQLLLVPVFQWLVPVKGKPGCESSCFYLFATQRVWGKSIVHHIYNASSEMDCFLWTGKKKGLGPLDWEKKETSWYRSVQRTLVTVYHYALMEWVRELPSTSIIAFTFDSSCSVEGLQSVTQHVGFTGQSACPGGNRFWV